MSDECPPVDAADVRRMIDEAIAAERKRLAAVLRNVAVRAESGSPWGALYGAADELDGATPETPTVDDWAEWLREERKMTAARIVDRMADATFDVLTRGEPR